MEPSTAATKSLQNAYRLFLSDLEILPEEAFTRKFAEKTRTVADIAYEVSLVNDHSSMILRGEEPFAWPEGWVKAPPELTHKAQVIDAFTQTRDKVMETVNRFSEEALSEPITTPEGPSTRGASVRFMTLHMWYHLGQLNFIQTLLGDDRWNWN